MTRRPRTLIAMAPRTRDALLDAEALTRLGRVAACDPGLVVDDFGVPGNGLAEAEVLLTGWGCPPLSARALLGMPALKAVVHTAGSVKSHVTPSCWDRGIVVSSAAWANALPVAEFTLAAVLFAGKRALESAREYRERRAALADRLAHYADVGNFRRTVGVVGASLTGRRVLELLRPFDLVTLLHDPFVTAREAARLGAEAVGLDELARRADVVTLHAPSLASTHGMFDARRLALMPDGATLVNTARGSLVDTAALTAEVVSGRLRAVLDHTEPEVLPADSPLYDAPNVLLTPHIAGSLGNELSRLAHAALDELTRYARGLPFAHPVGAADLATMA